MMLVRDEQRAFKDVSTKIIFWVPFISRPQRSCVHEEDFVLIVRFCNKCASSTLLMR